MIIKSDRKSKKSNNSYIFDYREHAMVIFDVFNLFRTKPLKFFKKMIKNGLWTETDIERANKLNNVSKHVKWSDEVYNMLYIRDGIEDRDIINKLLTEIINTKCDSTVFRIDGDYDPEMSVLMLIYQYSKNLEILLSDKYHLGTVTCYNDPDRIFFYLIRKFI